MLAIIAAMAKNRVIGNNNKLPWHLPEDLKRFRELTLGNVVVMGRKTYESIQPPLRFRTVIVITHQHDYKVVNGFATDNLDIIYRFGSEKVFIAGGQTLYEQTIDKVDKIYLTSIDLDVEGNSYFPEIKGYNIVNFDTCPTLLSENGFYYNFFELDKSNITNFKPAEEEWKKVINKLKNIQV